MSLSGLVAAIHALEEVFDRIGLTRSYGGAIAYNYYAPPRLTQDIDVLALIQDARAPGLVDALRDGGCTLGAAPPSPVELKGFLDELRGTGRFAALRWKGVPVEGFSPWHPFHRRVLERSPERDLEGRRIRIHAPEDLVVFKKIFDRPKDIQDIKAILLSQRGRLDTPRLLADAKELLVGPSWKELSELVTELS